MKFAKWLFLIGLSVFLIIASSAVLAQSSSSTPDVTPGYSPQYPHPTPQPNSPQYPHRTAQSNWSQNGDHHPYGHWHRYPPTTPAYTYTEPLTCTLPTQLEGKTQAEVAQSYSSLREAIGSSDVLVIMPHGAVVTIVSGPVCSGGTDWYEVSYNGQTGWVTEGGSGEYWLEPVTS